jgi:hypothetical protein
MNGVAFWMAEHVCPLLTYLGLHACSTATDLYLVGVAGWIFGGIGLLMLMGISDEIETRKATRRMVQTSHALELTRNAPIQQMPQSAERPVPAKRRPIHHRVRSMSRRNPVDHRADPPKPIRSAHP